MTYMQAAILTNTFAAYHSDAATSALARSYGAIADDAYNAVMLRFIAGSDATEKQHRAEIAANRAGNWEYRNDENRMGDGGDIARITSDNTLKFSFPYDGEQHASLMLVHRNNGEQRVVFSIEKGQILCSSYECDLRIRLDGQKPFTARGKPSADRSSTLVFFDNARALTKSIGNANSVVVEFTAYKQGLNLAEFRTKGLVWPPKKGNQK